MIRVYVNGKERELREYSLTIQETVNERATCSFSLKTDLNTVLEKGHPVSVETESEELFNGFIQEATYKDYPTSNARLYAINCSDLHYLVDKRTYVRGFENKTCGEIVKTMVDEILADEGIRYTKDSISDGFNLPAISFNYKKCSEILDQLAEIAGFVWYVDYDAVLHFKQSETIGRGPIITDSIVKDGSLQINNKNNQYRNKQYVKGATAETGIITQKFFGDGANQSFSLGYRLADKPILYIDGQKVLDDDVVIKGYNDTAKWFYQKQDGVILQNPEHEPLMIGQELKVEYKGIFPIIAISESTAEIERYKKLGAGTGIVEVVDDESDLTSLGTAISVAVGRLGRFCGDTWEIKFQTRATGYDIGQTVDFNLKEKTDYNYLITNIEITDDVGFVWYTITAAKGALVDSWERVLGNGLRTKPTVANIDLEEQETVVLNKSFSKTWTHNENPNIMRILYPNGTYTASGWTPTFEFDYRINYVEIIDTKGNVMTRNIKSVQTDPSANTIYTYFYIDPFAAVGEWAEIRFYGGYQATFEYGSGVLIDTVSCRMNKSNLEGIQIARTDIKGF